MDCYRGFSVSFIKQLSQRARSTKLLQNNLLQRVKRSIRQTEGKNYAGNEFHLIALQSPTLLSVKSFVALLQKSKTEVDLLLRIIIKRFRYRIPRKIFPVVSEMLISIQRLKILIWRLQNPASHTLPNHLKSIRGIREDSGKTDNARLPFTYCFPRHSGSRQSRRRAREIFLLCRCDFELHFP